MRSGLIKKEAKDRLTLDMIECMTEGQPSMTEKAYRMLVHNRLDGPQTTLTKDGVVDDVLEEFSEQCNLIADILVTRSEEEEDGTREVQDENEEEEDVKPLSQRKSALKGTHKKSESEDNEVASSVESSDIIVDVGDLFAKLSDASLKAVLSDFNKSTRGKSKVLLKKVLQIFEDAVEDGDESSGIEVSDFLGQWSRNTMILVLKDMRYETQRCESQRAENNHYFY